MTPDAIAALVEAISPRPSAQPRRPVRKGWVRRLIDAVFRAEETYRQRQRLQELPDYMLKDIGLTRHDVSRGWRR